MKSGFKVDKQNRTRCIKCHHFHSEKRNKPIRCIALFSRKCDQCNKVALTGSLLTNIFKCDIHRDKTCKHCSQKVYRQKKVCAEHLCTYTLIIANRNNQNRVVRCRKSSNSYGVHCRQHFIYINKLCKCGKIPYGWIIVGILYRRGIISRDIFNVLLGYVKWHYPYYPCLHRQYKT